MGAHGFLVLTRQRSPLFLPRGSKFSPRGFHALRLLVRVGLQWTYLAGGHHEGIALE